ncbi:nodulation protein NfeD [Egicoccus sp. AB-alg2]|uniref:NfeD family protein n=1 Tax=Egicoccus sp. AB-alg2 TaxID=3242693 RepID=UPI00359D5D86
MSVSLAAVRRTLVLAVLALLLVGLTATFATAQTEGADEGASAASTRVEILPVSGFVDPPVAAQIEDVIDVAEADGSQLIVLQVDSRGGVSVNAAALVDRMRASTVPIAVLVGPLGEAADAQGAAALLWLGADVRAASADALVGPIEPVTFDERDDTPLEHDLRDVIEAAGGSADVADRLLTEGLDPGELAQAGLLDVEAQGLEPLLLELDGVALPAGADGGEQTLRIRGDEIEVRFHSLGLVRRLLHAATTAPFIYLLLTIGLGMLLFELFQPGFGVAGLAGVITAGIGAFGLTVLPVVWWGVALVVLGLILYAVDTAIAGFGPVTVAATAAFVIGSLNFYAADALTLPVWLVVATALTALVFFVFVMTTVLRAQAGPEGVSVEDLVGRPGIVRSVLNPEGHVYIDGALWRARWTGDTKRAKVGTPVRVHGVEGAVVLVEPFAPEADHAATANTAAPSDPTT